MKVIVTKRAHNDLINLFYYNTKKSINFALEANKKIRSYIRDLEKFPYLGRYISEIPNKNYRERIYKNYRIIYYISEEENKIYIQYVFSSRQDLKSFFDLHIKDFLKF